MDISQIMSEMELESASFREFNDINYTVLEDLGIDLDYAEQFDGNFSLEDIVLCYRAGISPETANGYKGLNINEIIYEECPYKKTLRYT